jgi:MFS family permease
VVGLLIRFGAALGEWTPRREHADGQVRAISYARLIASPAIMMAFGYFLLTAFAGTGFQTFSTASLVDFYGVTLRTAASALTAYLVGSSMGILLGGQLADRTTHHARVAMSGLAACSLLMGVVATGAVSFNGIMVTVFFAGLAQGCTSPSRDILVKRATPPGATGKVFGFVYSGLDAGSTAAPLFFGALLDHHLVRLIFLCIGLLYALSIFSVLTVSRHPQ